MFDSLKLILLGFASLGTLGLVLLGALVRLRDELVNQQVISESSWLGRQSVRAQRRQVMRVLSEVGFRPDHFAEIRTTLDVYAGEKRYGVANARCDEQLLSALKLWTRQLEPGFINPANLSYYVDTMGAMDYSADESTMARINHQWLLFLQRKKLVPPADCFLTCKDGNVALVRQVCKLSSAAGQIKPIVAKGDKDPSRVKRTTDVPHWTDFEGLAAFLEANKDDISREKKLRIIAVDDNCTTGTMLCSAIRRFNEFIEDTRLPFLPIEHAVVLFAVRPDHDRAGESTRLNFERIGVCLHAIFGLGQPEMQRIVESAQSKRVETPTRFKDGFGCGSSQLM